MTGCYDYGANIPFFIDKELNGQELEEFRAHLEECETCRAELEAVEELSHLLQRTRPLYAAPDALRRQVMQTVGLLPTSATYAPSRLRKRVLKVLAQPVQTAGRGVRRWPMLVVAILLVAALLLPIPGILRQVSAKSYVEAAVAAHRGSRVPYR